MKRGKKKNGSTLVLMIAITMMIVILGATLTSATLYTAKMNINEKRNTDLIVSAESGLDYGVEKLFKSDVRVNEEITIANASANIEKVFVRATNTGTNTVKIESTAYSRDGKNYTVSKMYSKSEPPRGLNDEIFEFGLNAGQGNIKMDATGAIDLKSTTINSALSPEYNVNGNIEVNEAKNNNYQDLNFISKFKKSTKVTVGDIDSLKSYRTVDESGNTVTSVDLNYYNPTTNTNNIYGVGYFTLHGYTVYLVNADELEILPVGGKTMHKTIIICKGKITIKSGEYPLGSGLYPGGELDGQNACVYANSINIDRKGGLKITGSPKKSLEHTPNGFELTNIQLVDVTNKIKLYITNFGGGGSPVDPSLPAGGAWESIEGSYEN